MNSWLKSKTLWVGLAVGLLGLVQSTLETAPLSQQTSGIVMTVIGAVMMILRSVTTDAIRLPGQRE